MRIHGICPPVTTPFTAEGNVDEATFREDIRFMVEDAGVHGVSVGGSTGEGHVLSTDEVRTLVGAAVEVAAGRIPVIAGIIVDSTWLAIERGRALADLDVAALQVTPVHYGFRPGDDGTQAFFADIIDGTGTPVLIYNVVQWNYLDVVLLGRIMREVDGVIGVKQSAGDFKLMADAILELPEESIIMSAVDALMYPSLALGADVAIAAMLSLAPSSYVEMWDVLKDGNHDRARELHEALLPIFNALEATDDGGRNMPAAVKYAMERQGRPAGLPRTPMSWPGPGQKALLDRALAGANLADG